MSIEHTLATCGGCREVSLIDTIEQVRRLCLDGWAFENIGRKVVATKDVLAILDRSPVVRPSRQSTTNL